jgi:hypothetical protein
MTPLLAMNIYYQLPFLLIVVSLVYSAARHDRWSRIWKEAAGWILRMTGFLGGLGLVLYVLSTHPHLWPYAAVIGGIAAVIYYGFMWGIIRKKETPAENAEAPKEPRRYL